MARKNEVARRKTADGEAALARLDSLSLDQLARHANAEAREAENRALYHACRAGIFLLEARSRCEQSGAGWYAWLADEWHYSRRHADRCTELAEACGSDPARIQHLGAKSIRGALADLGKPVDGSRKSESPARKPQESNNRDRSRVTAFPVSETGVADVTDAEFTVIPPAVPPAPVASPPPAGPQLPAVRGRDELDDDQGDERRFELEERFAPDYRCAGCPSDKPAAGSAYMLECHWVDWPDHRRAAELLAAGLSVCRVPSQAEQEELAREFPDLVQRVAAAPERRADDTCHPADEPLECEACGQAHDYVDCPTNPTNDLGPDDDDGPSDDYVDPDPVELARAALERDPCDTHAIGQIVFERAAALALPAQRALVTHEQHSLCLLKGVHEQLAFKLQHRQHVSGETRRLLRTAEQRVADALVVLEEAARRSVAIRDERAGAAAGRAS
ncbi:MAG: hypothetical protein KF878_00310 [Planctomycetes bacterium]|nr:hypothetical protein [Planctomycetota bacterium]